jgi:hypothetical protein
VKQHTKITALSWQWFDLDRLTKKLKGQDSPRLHIPHGSSQISSAEHKQLTKRSLRGNTLLPMLQRRENWARDQREPEGKRKMVGERELQLTPTAFK